MEKESFGSLLRRYDDMIATEKRKRFWRGSAAEYRKAALLFAEGSPMRAHCEESAAFCEKKAEET